MKLALTLTLLILTSFSFAYGQKCAELDYSCRIKAVQAAMAANPKDPENYYEVGRIYQTARLHAQAIDAFTMYVTIPGLKPEHLADGYNNRGISYRALKKFDLALADYKKAFELNPKDPRLVVNHGNVNSDMGKFTEAKADYDRAIQVDPNFALAYTNRGHLHLRMKKPVEAISDLNKSIELDPTNPEAYYTRAVAFRANNQNQKAVSDLDKYIELNTTNLRYLVDGYVNRGIAHALMGNLEKALVDLTKAIELAPVYLEAFKARAQVYRDMKKFDLAAADEKTAEELGNPNPPAPPKKP